MSVTEVDLAVLDLTRTSCAQGVQNRLIGLPGVIAAVNYPTESAHIAYSADYELFDKMRAGAQTGHEAVAPDESTAGLCSDGFRLGFRGSQLAAVAQVHVNIKTTEMMEGR